MEARTKLRFDGPPPAPPAAGGLGDALPGTRVPDRDRQRVLTAAAAKKCCGSEFSNKAGVIRLLNDISGWISDIRADFNNPPTDTDGNVMGDNQVPPPGRQVTWAMIKALPGGELVGGNASGFKIPDPAPGSDFERLLNKPVSNVSELEAVRSNRPEGTRIHSSLGWSAVGVLVGAITVDLFYSYQARRSTSQVLATMEQAMREQIEKLQQIPEELTETCEECIERSLLRNDKQQDRKYGKFRTRQ